MAVSSSVTYHFDGNWGFFSTVCPDLILSVCTWSMLLFDRFP